MARTKSALYSLQSSRLNTMGLCTENIVCIVGFQMPSPVANPAIS